MAGSKGQPARWGFVFAFAAIYLIWGSTFLAIRYAVETLPPFLMMGIRSLTAGVILYGYARLRGAEKPVWREWAAAMLMGGLFFLGGHGALAWAEQRVASGLAALLIATQPLWVAVLDWGRTGGAAPSKRIAIGLVLGFIGIGLLTGPGEIAGGRSVDRLSAAVLVMGAFSWAAGTVYARQAPRPASLILATGMQLAAGGGLLLMTGALTGEWARFTADHVSRASILSLGYLIVFGSLVGFTAYVWLLKVTSLASVSTYAYVNPVVAVLLGATLGGEALNLRTVAAIAVIVMGVAVVVMDRSRALPAVPAAARPGGDLEAALHGGAGPSVGGASLKSLSMPKEES